MRLFVVTIAFRIPEDTRRGHPCVTKVVQAKTLLEASTLALDGEDDDAVHAYHIQDLGGTRVVEMSREGLLSPPELRRMEREGADGWIFRHPEDKRRERPSLREDQIATGIEVGFSDAFLERNEAKIGPVLRDRRGQIVGLAHFDAAEQRVRTPDPDGHTVAYVGWEREDGPFSFLTQGYKTTDLTKAV